MTEFRDFAGQPLRAGWSATGRHDPRCEHVDEHDAASNPCTWVEVER